jgi:hypothetical protein
MALTATQGYIAEALAHNLQHALGLCAAVEATTELVPVLVALTRLSMLRGDRSATEQLLTRERALLTQLDDTASLIQLHTQLGTAETLRGAYAQAAVHQQYVLRLSAPLAKAHLQRGQVAAGLAVIEEAVQATHFETTEELAQFIVQVLTA